MNKKKRTSYLLLLVVLIYATIGIRFFLLKDGGNPNLVIERVGDFKPITYTINEDFTIVNDYRDPFLGTLPIQQKTKNTTIPKTQQTKTTAPFPDVQFMGVVADAGSSKKILSIRIQNIEYVVRVGDEIEGLQILSGNEERITVRHNGVQKIIKKPEL